MKSNFAIRCHVGQDVIAGNLAHAATLDLPAVERASRPKLAVVGAGQSVVAHVDELRAWDGDLWACGSAFQWCVKNGIDAAFFFIDPAHDTAHLARGANKAILATCCAPELFEALRGADVRTFELRSNAQSSNHGVTTMTAAPELATTMGYVDTTFFGGESSFDVMRIFGHGQTHVTQDHDMQVKMHVRVGAQLFGSCAEFLMQAEFLAQAIRMFPSLYRERSGGLLAALVSDPDYDITWIEGGMRLAA